MCFRVCDRWLVPLLALALAPVVHAAEPADLVLRGGKIVTVDDRQPTAEALAARGDRIVAVGSDAELAKLIGPQTQVIELGGKTVVPGFIEGHGHFTWLGQARMMLDLRSAQSWDEIVTRVEKAVQKAAPGQWIVGNGWHQEKWTVPPEPNVNGYPTHDRLSRVSPNNPVLLTHGTGHMCVANAEAMRRAGVDASTPNPPGGEVLKDDQGRPIGVFRETAQNLVERAQAAAPGDLRKAIELATAECLANGVTSFQDAGSSFATIDALKAMAAAGQLKVRLWIMVREGDGAVARRLAAYRMVGFGNHYLTVRGIKRSIDGALGSHGAWMLEPYDDLPESRGLNTRSLDSLRETAELALKHDYQLCVHAIGDRANREVLNLFEQVQREHPSSQSRRWRIEHAQHLHPDDIPRFAQSGTIASMQGVHCTSDAPFIVARLGTGRARSGAYVWRSLLDAGALVTNGTDAPVEELSPIASFYASVTRRLPGGSTFFPEQCMTREEALRSYTRDAAYAAFEEDLKGSLTPGKLADAVVLSQDLMTVPEDKLLDTRVLMTIVGGKVAYQADEPAYDLVLRGGRIIDGTGNPWFYGDVAVRGDRIAAVGKVADGAAKREIDVRGLAVAPGFIDMHSHSDFLLLEDGDAQSKIRQGVTTEILGEGNSPGPYQSKLPPRAVAVNGQSVRWNRLGEYFKVIERAGVSPNVASYVGLNNIWQCVMGDSFERPSSEQLEKMKALVDEAMRDGALGLSSQVMMPPGSLATTDEIVELCKVVAKYGGIYSTHIRNEGTGVFDSVREAIEIGERAEVGVDVIHLKIADQKYWGRMNEVISLIEDARRRGVNVQANVYPYTRGNNNLASIIPPWAHEGGDREMLARLKDPEQRQRMKHDIQHGIDGWYNHYTAVGGDWSRMLISGAGRFQGLTMDRVLALRTEGKNDRDPLEELFDLLIEENGSVSTVYAHHTEEDMNLALVQPWCSIGSDGSAYAVEGKLRRGNPHPRNFGTFPRVLGVYVRERKLLTLEDAVRKMTSLNAAKVGLHDRGLLRPGMAADITVFDPNQIVDRSTYTEPFQYSEGVQYVVVNGQFVLDQGRHTHVRPGRPLRR